MDFSIFPVRLEILVLSFTLAVKSKSTKMAAHIKVTEHTLADGTMVSFDSHYATGSERNS